MYFAIEDLAMDPVYFVPMPSKQNMAKSVGKDSAQMTERERYNRKARACITVWISLVVFFIMLTIFAAVVAYGLAIGKSHISTRPPIRL